MNLEIQYLLGEFLTNGVFAGTKRWVNPNFEIHINPMFIVFTRRLLSFADVGNDLLCAARKSYYAFLGDTILVDDLDAAEKLMKCLLDDHTADEDPICILTRDGFRLKSDGVSGGKHNNAPDFEILSLKLKLAQP